MLLKVLSDGMVEIHRATEPFEIEGAFYGKGSYVVKHGPALRGVR
jgi:hypothetical protein